jgi:hypothetical protein
MHWDFAALCGEGLSHTAKVRMEGIRPLWRAAPHSYFGHHDALVAPLQRPIFRDARFVIMACALLSNLF